MMKQKIKIYLFLLMGIHLLAACTGDSEPDPKTHAGIVSNKNYMNEYMTIGEAVSQWDACIDGTRVWDDFIEVDYAGDDIKKASFSCDLKVKGYFKKLRDMAAKDASENFDDLMGMKHINITLVFDSDNQKYIVVDRIEIKYEWLDGVTFHVVDRDGSDEMYKIYRNHGIYSPREIDMINATDLKLKHKKLKERGIALAKSNKLNADQGCVGALVLRTACVPHKN